MLFGLIVEMWAKRCLPVFCNWSPCIELGRAWFPLSVVYPSLESDEDDPALKSLPKKKKCTDDAPWSPKGKNPSPVTGTGALMWCCTEAGRAPNSISWVSLLHNVVAKQASSLCGSRDMFESGWLKCLWRWEDFMNKFFAFGDGPSVSHIGPWPSPWTSLAQKIVQVCCRCAVCLLCMLCKLQNLAFLCAKDGNPRGLDFVFSALQQKSVLCNAARSAILQHHGVQKRLASQDYLTYLKQFGLGRLFWWRQKTKNSLCCMEGNEGVFF